ncbi:MAG TPA: MarR family transcriptional regulator [Chloroflexota bacterium]
MQAERTDSLATAAALTGFARALNARLRETPRGLALADLNVLSGIDKGYDLSSALARRLLLDAPRVSRIVEGLVSEGYVQREADSEDRRRWRLRLTPSGVERLDRGRIELAAAMDDLLHGLSDEERDGLERAVPGMRRVLADSTE